MRTFADHAREMGAAPPAEPVFFLKPEAALAAPPMGSELVIDAAVASVHHEVELVVSFGLREGLLYPEMMAVGLDLTDRTVQAVAKAEGLPWTRAKGFAQSAVVGEFVPAPVTFDDMRLELSVNGAPRQESPLSHMTFDVVDLVSTLESWAPLREGDLLFCGTPAGVGELQDGDLVHARLLDGNGAVMSELEFILRRA